MNNLINIEQKDGVNVVSSRLVAEKFCKRHSDVLRAIDDKILANVILRSPKYFIEDVYLDQQNKSRKHYWMTRDGFSFIVMGFTGSEADKWKLEFIDAFNKIEQQLLQINERDRLLVGLFSNDPAVVAQSHKALLELETKPLVKEIEDKDTLINTVIKDDNIFAISDVGRILKAYCDFMGANKIFDFMRSEQILINDKSTSRHNLPYAKYEKHFNVKLINKGDRTYSKTYFTGSGLKWFLNKLVKNGYLNEDQKVSCAKELV